MRETTHARTREGQGEILKDRFGHEIPEGIAADWIEASEFSKKHIAMILEVVSALESGCESRSRAFFKVPETLSAELLQTANILKSVMLPFTVCPACQAHNPEKCRMCKQTGWLTKFIYESPVVTRTTKKLWEKK